MQSLGQAPPRQDSAAASASAPLNAYDLAAAALRKLGAAETDAVAWEQLLAATTALGVDHPVRRRLAAALPGAAAALLARIPPLAPARRVPWSTLAGQFAANLQTLRTRAPELATAVERAWSSSRSELELYHSRGDGVQVCAHRGPAAEMWRPALAPHHAYVSREALADQWRGRLVRTLIIHGLGLGHAALDIICASRTTFLQFQPLVAIYEPEPLAWALALHLHDWTRALAEPRVRLLAGPSAAAALEELLADPDRGLPALIAGGPPWPGAAPESALRDLIAAAEQRRAARTTQLVQAVAARHRDRTTAEWAACFARAAAGETRLRVLGVTSRFTTVLQHAMRDWLAAFARAGHATRLVIEPDDHAHFSPLRIAEALADFDPHLLLQIDHLQAECGLLYPDNIPGVCWIQDNLPHLFQPAAGAAVRPLEFVVGHGFDECVGRFGYPAGRFLPARMPTNPAKFVVEGETEADLAPYRCDVMFASNMTLNFAQRLARARDRFAAAGPAGLIFSNAFAELEAALRHPWFDGYYDFDALVARALTATCTEGLPPAVRNDLTNELLMLADQHLREDTVRAAAAWAAQTGGTLRLYGHGWDQQPEFAVYAHGPVAHGLPLGRAFRGAKIALHAGCNSALHQRVLDGLAAGGFLLIRDKLADTEHLRFAAMVRWLEQADAKPTAIRAADLPQPVADWVRRQRFWAGLDPDGSVTLRDSHIDWWYQRMRETAADTPSGIWPDLPRVLFRDGAALAEKLSYYVAHAEERRAIAERMRNTVIEQFSYDALVAELLRFISTALRARPTSGI